MSRDADRLLALAATTAIEVFGGPVGYSAASWEDVDWSRFDSVGLSLYRSGSDNHGYARRVSAVVREHSKPVIITEFGCGAYTGAELRGPGSFRTVSWFREPPVIRGDHPRDEQVQADYLGDLIDLYARTGIAGCFVFTFAMPDFPRREDPRLDLDKAGFGIVALPENGTAWKPKAAFVTVARSYRRLER